MRVSALGQHAVATLQCQPPPHELVNAECASSRGWERGCYRIYDVPLALVLYPVCISLRSPLRPNWYGGRRPALPGRPNRVAVGRGHITHLRSSVRSATLAGGRF